VRGNVLLRKKQYQVSENEAQSVPIAASFLLGKIANSRKVIERAIRDHAMLVDVEALGKVQPFSKRRCSSIPRSESLSELMASRAARPRSTSGVFDQLILQQRMTSSSKNARGARRWTT
jgi:CRISP-associated protein Cas1